MSKDPSSRRNFTRFRLERLQAESSKNMYSEQGLLALIRPVLGHVCQRLIVVSYWTPGSAQAHALSAMVCQSSAASSVSTTSPVVRECVCHLPLLSASFMNASVTRTELFEFWPLTVR